MFIKVYLLTAEKSVNYRKTQKKQIPGACQTERNTTLIYCVEPFGSFLYINWILILEKPYTLVLSLNVCFLWFVFCSWSLRVFDTYYTVMWLLLTNPSVTWVTGVLLYVFV